MNVKGVNRLVDFLRVSSVYNRPFSSYTIPTFATVNPYTLSSKEKYIIPNLVAGEWTHTEKSSPIVDPLTGDIMFYSSNTQENEFKPFIQSMSGVPISGKHNVFKNPERFEMYADVFHKAAVYLDDPNYFEFFIKCIQKTMPKEHNQAKGEVKLITDFFKTFSGNSIRFMMKGFSVAGDHAGQISNGYRWPYGPVCIISPFNFPLEIPGLQMLSAMMVGNKPLLKPHSKQSLVVEQFIRFLHFCGLPKDEIDLINTSGPTMSKLIDQIPFKMLQFTGGTDTAMKLMQQMNGKMRCEISGFDWKVLGPDVDNFDFVANQCDQDAYAISGQKCSAQSILFVHKNWVEAGLLNKIKDLANKRHPSDLSASPLLSITNEEIYEHQQLVLSYEGSELLFGGGPFEGVSAVDGYGMYKATAVYVQLKSFFKGGDISSECDSEAMAVLMREIFGPFQIIVTYTDSEIEALCKLLSWPHTQQHLTAAIVSNSHSFTNKLLAHTVDGTTYTGLSARTTGAPTNHWFGGGNSPYNSGIGAPKAILQTWTAHREIIQDTAIQF